MKFQNFRPQTSPKSDVQNFCPMKLVFLALKFGRNHVFRQFLLYLPPPMIYMVGKPRISASIWHQAIKILCILQAVRISGTDPDRLLSSSWHCVLSVFWPDVYYGKMGSKARDPLVLSKILDMKFLDWMARCQPYSLVKNTLTCSNLLQDTYYSRYSNYTNCQFCYLPLNVLNTKF